MSDGNNTINSSEPKKAKKKVKLGKIIFIILLSLLILGLAAYGINEIYTKYSPIVESKGILAIFDKDNFKSEVTKEVIQAEPATPAPTQEPKAKDNSKSGLTAADIYEENVECTVAITTSGTMNYWGYQVQTGAKGSGFIITDDGYILTNYHVIEDSEKVTVATFDGKSYDAKIIGYSTSDDIAVLKINGTFKSVKQGSSDSLRVGDDVLAIGNPLGELTFSLTKGIVSALDRPVQLSSNNSMNLIQIDCAINSGNSGGALFNMNGEVVGITNAKYSSSGSSTEASIENIGFAIPIDSVQKIVQNIIEYGYVVRPYLGLTPADVSNETLKATGLSNGVLVAAITENEAASKAGIQENDIIISLDGDKVKSAIDFKNILYKHEPGDVISLEVYRKGEVKTISVTLGEITQAELDQSANYQSQYSSQQNSNSPFGYGYGNGNGNGGSSKSYDSIEDFIYNYFG